MEKKSTHSREITCWSAPHLAPAVCCSFHAVRLSTEQQRAAYVSPCARPIEVKCSVSFFRMILANHFQRDTMAHPLLPLSFFFSPRDVANAIGTRVLCRPLNKLSLFFIPAVVIFFHLSHTKRCRSDSSSIAAFLVCGAVSR